MKNRQVRAGGMSVELDRGEYYARYCADFSVNDGGLVQGLVSYSPGMRRKS